PYLLFNIIYIMRIMICGGAASAYQPPEIHAPATRPATTTGLPAPTPHLKPDLCGSPSGVRSLEARIAPGNTHGTGAARECFAHLHHGCPIHAIKRRKYIDTGMHSATTPLRLIRT